MSELRWFEIERAGTVWEVKAWNISQARFWLTNWLAFDRPATSWIREKKDSVIA